MKVAIVALLWAFIVIVRSDCSCGLNEEYRECRPCPPINCREKPAPCPKICIIEPGCYCKSGYLRKNGTCVPEAACNCGNNEEYLECQPCRSETCGIADPEVCILICRNPGCYCKENFKRKNGKCIPENECETCY